MKTMADNSWREMMRFQDHFLGQRQCLRFAHRADMKRPESRQQPDEAAVDFLPVRRSHVARYI